MKNLILALLIAVTVSAVTAYAKEVKCELPLRDDATGDVYTGNLCAP
jgi:hypothetical protein